jgi:SAM-dependent methyltransferase
VAADQFSLDDYYDAYPRVEEAFQRALDVRLGPRGPDLLFELVDGLGLKTGSSVIDVGCGEGGQALTLVQRFGFHVLGIDPVARHIELANQRLDDERFAQLKPWLRFEQGSAEALAAADASVALVWCRDVLVHVADLEKAYNEIHRVLTDGGQVVLHLSSLATRRLEPGEADWIWRTTGVLPASANPERHETAIAAAGFTVDERLEVGAEWAEWREEHNRSGSQRMLHTVRLLRDPGRYIAQFGQTAYDIMLADCLWHLYHAIGKLDARVYVLSKR